MSVFAGALDPGPTSGTMVMLRRFALTAPTVLKSPLLFQLPPLDTAGGGKARSWNDTQTVNRKTFSRPIGGDLEQITLSFLLADFDLDEATRSGSGAWRIRSPLERVRELEAIRDSDTPFVFLMGDERRWGAGQLDRSMYATLRSVTWESRAGEPESRYVACQFVEFAALPAVVKSGKGTAASPRLPATRAIKGLPASADTVAELAKFYYGSAHKWRLIQSANAWLKGWSPNRSLKQLPKATLKKHPSVRIPVDSSRRTSAVDAPLGSADTVAGVG